MGSTTSGYFDMLNEDQADTLLGLVDVVDDAALEYFETHRMTGSTNWEDALLRTFYRTDGTIDPVQPDMVVFFTDGVPTKSRVTATSAPSVPIEPPARLANYPAEDGSSYNQEAFYRASVIANRFRGLPDFRFIGVGVGAELYNNNTFITGLRGYHYEYFRKFNYTGNRSRWYHIEKSFHLQTHNFWNYQRGTTSSAASTTRRAPRGTTGAATTSSAASTTRRAPRGTTSAATTSSAASTTRPARRSPTSAATTSRPSVAARGTTSLATRRR